MWQYLNLYISSFSCNFALQSNKRSAFPHNGHSPAFIVTPPSLSLISTGRVPFTQRGMTLLPKGVRTFCLKGVVPFCLKGSYPFAQRGRTLLPKGVAPFCLKGSYPLYYLYVHGNNQCIRLNPHTTGHPCPKRASAPASIMPKERSGGKIG